MVDRNLVGTGVALLALVDGGEAIGLTRRIACLGAGDARRARRLGGLELLRVGGLLDAGAIASELSKSATRIASGAS